MKERNLEYDFLRFIGIACIILAHIEPNYYIFQARNFDVPLMVLLSGMSFAAFSSKSYQSYSKYLLDRFHRLVVPTWLFLLFLNILYFYMKNETPTFPEIANQIALINGLGVGVWIIRIFFSMAMIAPLLKIFDKKIKDDKIFLLILVSAWLVYEIVVACANMWLPQYIYNICNIIFFFTFSYGCIFLLGLRLLKINKKQLIATICFSYFLFMLSFLILYLYKGHFVSTQFFKYPPKIYYVSYALSISLTLLYLTRYTSIFNKFKGYALVQFIGRSTLWIYLWHWLSLKIYSYLNIEANIYIKYTSILLSATVMTYVQTKLIQFVPKLIEIKSQKYKRYKTIFIKKKSNK